MPAISTNELRNGLTLELDKGLFSVVDFQHVKPGKGGAFVRTKLRNVRTGAVIERTFNAGVRVEQAIIDRRDMQFLYKEGDAFVFMDTDTYEQITIQPVTLGDAADYLVESATAQIALFGTEIVQVEIPASVELTIAQTEPDQSQRQQCDGGKRREHAGHGFQKIRAQTGVDRQNGQAARHHHPNHR